eukprot:2192093-Rhodomonas_salina.1
MEDGGDPDGRRLAGKRHAVSSCPEERVVRARVRAREEGGRESKWDGVKASRGREGGRETEMTRELQAGWKV